MHHYNYIRNFYGKRLGNSSEHHEVLYWASAEAQRERFAILAQALRETFLPATASAPTLASMTPPTLLDVGCGFADLAVYLTPELATYTGIDITPEIVGAAQKEHPQFDLHCGDLFNDESIFAGRKFDVVFVSGTFNLRLDNNMNFLARALPKLKALATRLLVINFLHIRAARRYGKCFYYDPEQVRKLAAAPENEAAPLWNFSLRDDYLENDFTLIGKRR
jgi:SAM-dependent methyltransferase